MNINFDNFDIPNIESWKAQVQRETNKEKAIIYENKIEKIRVDLSNKDSNYDFQTNAESLKDNAWDIAVSFVIRNILGLGLPNCGLGVTVPISK